LGEHVTQKGSLVAPDRLRFDFSHPRPLSPDDVAAIEAEVNAQIRANAEVRTRLLTPERAVAEGALALFGEKYGEEVRVVAMGAEDGEEQPFSVELCGGTHVRRTGDIGLFKIVGESSVASGVRRIEALTGAAAEAYLAGDVTVVSRAEGKAAIVVGVTADLTDRFDAVELVRRGAEVLGGKGGGGRADMAQAGGPEADRADEALAAVERALTERAGELPLH